MKTEWNKILKAGHALYIGKHGFDALLVELDDFWKLVFRDILPKNDGIRWNHLKFHLEGSDGRFTCYPYDSGHSEDRICRAWATVGITVLAEEFQRLGGKADFENKAKVIYDRYAQAIADAAGRVTADKGPGSLAAVSLILRFHIYDNPAPFQEVVIDA
jgi:hypothetical protein